MKFLIKASSFFIVLFSLAMYSPAQVPVLYGMTSSGGINNVGGVTNGGTIYQINGDGSGFQTVYIFPQYSTPYGNLLLGGDGMLYGMTSAGGDSSGGSIFRFNPNNDSLSDLHDFYELTDTSVSDGLFPHGSLVEAGGTLYGMTTYGGIDGMGIVFSFNLNTNTFSDLHDFDSISGANPHGTLVVEHNSGLLYGMTSSGGIYNGGVTFTYNIGSSTFTKIYDFGIDSTDGLVPSGRLVQSVADGNYGILYGMTTYGGAGDDGTIFTINPANSNAYNKLYDFSSGNGSNPLGSLVQGYDGNFFGLTSIGGSYYSGNIFYFNLLINAYEDMYDFDSTEGAIPTGSLLLTTDSLLIGTTREGGDLKDGTIFGFNSSFSKIHDFVGLDGTAPTGDLTQTTYLTGVGPVNIKTTGMSVIPNPCTQCNLLYAASDVNDLAVTDITGRNIQVTYNREANGYAINFPSDAEGIFIIQNRRTGEVTKFVKE